MTTECQECGLVTPRRLAEILSVKPSTISRWRLSEGLPCVRLSSKTFRYDIEAVRDWMSKRGGESEQ